jgi:hypothetical protein
VDVVHAAWRHADLAELGVQSLDVFGGEPLKPVRSQARNEVPTNVDL